MLKLKMKIEEVDGLSDFKHCICLEEEIEPCYDLGETDLSVIGNFVHHALAAAGYPMEGDTVLLQGVTFEEADMMESFLEDMRANRKGDE